MATISEYLSANYRKHSVADLHATSAAPQMRVVDARNVDLACRSGKNHGRQYQDFNASAVRRFRPQLKKDGGLLITGDALNQAKVYISVPKSGGVDRIPAGDVIAYMTFLEVEPEEQRRHRGHDKSGKQKDTPPHNVATVYFNPEKLKKHNISVRES